MKIIYYHCFAGISGDMNLAAMLDLGVPAEYLRNELQKLKIDGYSIEDKKALKSGIAGTQVTVTLTNDSHQHEHGHSHGHGHHQDHRTFSVIKEIISQSDLSKEVKQTSIAIFEKVAIAEGKIHDKPAEEVHFHEVGAVDSIVDIVGAAICYHYLKPDKVVCSTIELGGGFVHCAHGKYPVPAPATAEIVKGLPISKGTVNTETTTPTGAAILATIVDEFSDQLNSTIDKTAYGIGHKDFEIPNVLRVHMATNKPVQDGLETASAHIIECNLDDMPSEQYDFVMDKLFEAGAQDVFFTPIIMKKSRPASKISVLCDSKKMDNLTQILLQNTTTLGVRSHTVGKTMLPRTMRDVKTKFGTIQIKEAQLNGKIIKQKPEYDQCKKAAQKYDIPISDVIIEVLSEAKNTLK